MLGLTKRPQNGLRRRSNPADLRLPVGHKIHTNKKAICAPKDYNLYLSSPTEIPSYDN
jgi:hypothetical protein